MKKIHFYFFCFYNSMYKDGFYLESYLKAHGKIKMLPEDRSVFVLFLATWVWSIIVRLSIIDMLGHKIKLLFYSPLSELLWIAGIYALYFYYFVNNKFFSELYLEYKLTDKAVQRQGVKKVYWFLGLPFLLLPLISWLTSKYLHIY